MTAATAAATATATQAAQLMPFAQPSAAQGFFVPPSPPHVQWGGTLPHASQRAAAVMRKRNEQTMALDNVVDAAEKRRRMVPDGGTGEPVGAAVVEHDVEFAAAAAGAASDGATSQRMEDVEAEALYATWEESESFRGFSCVY